MNHIVCWRLCDLGLRLAGGSSIPGDLIRDQADTHTTVDTE